MASRPHSLTVRLGLWFAFAATLTFSGVGLYLYQSLAIQLQSRDDLELIGKVKLIRHLLEETTSVISIRDDPHRFLDAIAGHDGLIFKIKSTQGTMLLQNSLIPDEFVTRSIAPADGTPDASFVKNWTLASGLPTRAVAAWGIVGQTKEQVHIVVARTASDRVALLAAYRSEVLAAIVTGAILTAILGYFLVRRGLYQVQVIAQQAQTITAQHLETRLDAVTAPNELQILVRSFNAMLDRLQNSFQRLSQFSADMAHDLRTPLNNLMVQTQVALSKSRSIEDYQALLASNYEEYERLARMVESMLFLARADHAEITLDKQLLNASDELQRIADYFEGLADDAGVKIQVQASGDVLADAMLFRRAVNNLVANAIRYTPSGKVIDLLAQSFNGITTITVTNPGIGIAEEHIPRLFDRFYRTDQSRTDSSLSTGLGLAIVQSIMVLHGGQVNVSSMPNEVTQFRLKFPQSS
jgi:two-component system heavy metal sensor histidine kinase CusS